MALDEGFGVAYNDIDLCLRIRKAGYRVIWTPFARLVHLESASRGPEDDPVKRAQLQIREGKDDGALGRAPRRRPVPQSEPLPGERRLPPGLPAQNEAPLGSARGAGGATGAASRRARQERGPQERACEAVSRGSAGPINVKRTSAQKPGWVSRDSRFQLRGWAWNPAKPKESVAVSVRVDGEEVRTVRANERRPHLREPGMSRNSYGFTAILPLKYYDGVKRHLEIINRDLDRPIYKAKRHWEISGYLRPASPRYTGVSTE